ncbi:hypothetical protein Acr_00g0026190 [Actinidia rufa]|uniref:Reverse transcriptase Ty1/copia-type domain-containing protein n=1 Tax=Actinidia rufa TaxID=165716 RepID=A0A7J0DDJ8_9ERIC|nr:hypothetical protein Acr_00g0026190 [Actinidia rufa]
MSRFFETVPFFSDSTPSPDPDSEILAANDPIPPRPLPILEPPSSPPTLNGSLPPFTSQNPSPRAQVPLPASSLESDSYKSFLSQVDSISIPRSIHEAFQNPLWVSAMKMKMEALQHNRTWDLVALPKGECTIGCKWVFSVKYLADGSVDRYKARLVAKGFTQIPGNDASGIVQVKCGLKKAFDIKDLGPLCYFLGIKVARSLAMISAESGELLPDPSIYQRLVGRLIYLTNTRPDLTFVVSIVSQFMHSSCTSHLDAVYHILRYLKSCPDRGFFYNKKQAIVSRSSAEAEYRAMAQGTTIMLSSDSVLHERTKHIEVDIHFIREKVRSGVITPSFVPSYAQTTDMFTKSIGPSLLKSSLVKLGLVDIFASA